MTSAILYATVIWPQAMCDSLNFNHLAETTHLFKHTFLNMANLPLQLNHMQLKLCLILNNTIAMSCSLYFHELHKTELKIVYCVFSQTVMVLLLYFYVCMSFLEIHQLFAAHERDL